MNEADHPGGCLISFALLCSLAAAANDVLVLGFIGLAFDCMEPCIDRSNLIPSYVLAVIGMLINAWVVKRSYNKYQRAQLIASLGFIIGFVSLLAALALNGNGIIADLHY